MTNKTNRILDFIILFKKVDLNKSNLLNFKPLK